MNKTLLIIGICLLAVGIFTTIYSTTTTQKQLWGLYSTSNTATPYTSYSVPFFIGGIVLIIVGIVTGGKPAESRATKISHATARKVFKCEECGAEVPTNSKFCPDCGGQF